VTSETDVVTSDAKHHNDAIVNAEVTSPEPLCTTADALPSGLVTSSPAKLSEDVEDLEFKGNMHMMLHNICYQ